MATIEHVTAEDLLSKDVEVHEPACRRLLDVAVPSAHRVVMRNWSGGSDRGVVQECFDQAGSYAFDTLFEKLHKGIIIRETVEAYFIGIIVKKVSGCLKKKRESALPSQYDPDGGGRTPSSIVRLDEMTRATRAVTRSAVMKFSQEIHDLREQPRPQRSIDAPLLHILALELECHDCSPEDLAICIEQGLLKSDPDSTPDIPNKVEISRIRNAAAARFGKGLSGQGLSSLYSGQVQGEASFSMKILFSQGSPCREIWLKSWSGCPSLMGNPGGIHPTQLADLEALRWCHEELIDCSCCCRAEGGLPDSEVDRWLKAGQESLDRFC